jgi:hypothetical protein
MRRLRILTFIAVMLTIIVFVIKNRQPSTITPGNNLLVDKAWLHTNPHAITPQKDVRPPDQTFLTYPEWFLVFSPAEQADYFKSHTSTSFPYMKHVDQMWKGYGVVYDQIKGNYKFNTGYHAMIMVIAGSTTVEYSIKSLYESIIGRVTDPAQGQELTDEDKFNAAYMRSYVNFIEDTPWYEYDFNRQLKSLWTTTSFFGPHFTRKTERKYYLTTELIVKSAYGWLIGLGTKSAYETALLNTTIITDRLPADPANFPEIKNIKKLPGGAALMNLPRYAKFNPAVNKLAQAGVTFKEIAGNDNAIMLTVLTGKKLNSNNTFKLLFIQPIITQPGLNRIAIVTMVGELSNTVLMLGKNKIRIEHIYDY